MNRLQKKCFIVATGMHLLLFVILLVGPAFLSSSSKPDDLQTITFIPANLIDKPFTGGGESAVKPPPAAPVPKQPQVTQSQPVAPLPKPVEPVKQQTKVSQPDPVKVEPKQTKPNPESLEAKSSKPKPQISLTPVTRPRNSAQTSSQADSHAQELADVKRRSEQISKTAASLRDKLSSKTDIDTSPGFGGGGEAYASYSVVVKSIYESQWIPPDNTASDDATAKVSVTIASDGTVISSRITQLSGDEQTDASIQRTLDRVKFIAPFPQGAKETQRTFIINFNLKAKRLSA